MDKTLKRDLLCGTVGALIASITVSFWHAYHSATPKTIISSEVELERAGKEKIAVFYYSKDIPSGTVVTYDAITTGYLEMRKLPAGAITNEWIAIGRTSEWDLKKGQLISFQDFGLARKVPRQQTEQVHAGNKSKH